jgi:radical SAM superfamily enzyme
LLYGLPDQDLQSVFDSIDELSTCFPEEIQLGMLKILPDTPMVEIAQKRGWLWAENPPYEVLQTDTLSFAELRLLDSYARVLNLYWNKGEFVPQWEKLLKKHKASDVISATIKQHEKDGFALHSISKHNRSKVFESVVNSFGLSFS